MDDFDLQSQLDAQLGGDYNSDLQDNSMAGMDYLGGQTDWNFGNYGDQWAGYNSQYDPTFGLQSQGYQTMAPEQWVSPGMENPSSFMQAIPDTNWNPNQGGDLQSVLSGLFSGQQGKALTAGLAAVLEGAQNKKRAAALSGLQQQVQQQTDPFGSQRGYYQQQLQNTVSNPYAQPIVASQVAALQKAQALKDAAAGRRSNTATSSPALIAAQAQVAQNYMNSLMNPAGAGIAPNANVMSQLGQQQAQYGSSGYLSPLVSALGQAQKSNINQQTQTSALQALLQSALSGGQ